MKDRRKSGIVINSNFLLSIVTMLIGAYIAYVVADIRDIKKVLLDCQKQWNETRQVLMSHLAWHKGKGNKKERRHDEKL